MEAKSEKHILQSLELVLTCLFLVSVYLLSREGARMVSGNLTEKKTIVIDAGHGGGDPGKESSDGILEKDVNLAIAKKLESCLQKKGYRVTMTRTEDVMLGKRSESRQKVADMQERCRIINESKADCAVSIHQNSYPDTAICGAQVFYCEGSEEGERLAVCLQRAMIRSLNPENHRREKANGTYYLLKKTEIPIVIAECGFLSNAEERHCLTTEEYQQKVAEAICMGIESFLKNKDSV